MARSYLPLHLILASLLTALALQSDASPTASRSDNRLVMFNSSLDMIISHCYTPDGADTPGIQPVETDSCNAALKTLVHTPDYTTPFRFSRNPRTLSKRLPTGWQFGDKARCRIVVNCENDRDSAVFRFADVAPIAKKIMDHCVYKPDTHGRYPILKWGGVDRMEGLETENFYVAVARPLENDGMANGTVVAGGEMLDGEIQIL